MNYEVLESTEDTSVNFVFSGDYPGFFEARYVRRGSRKMAVYLSSQSGCNQGCRMCHLTITRQTKSFNATLDIYMNQAETVFDWYDKNCPQAEMVHFNFMARGEALTNPLFLENGQELFYKLGEMAVRRRLQVRFLVSTIMPTAFMGKVLGKFFPVCGPEIYYSIYSIKEEFRRRWLPNAMPVEEALRLLKDYHDATKKVLRLHWAFIEGENDGEEDIVLMCHRVKTSGIPVEIRIVRYNPYDESYGRESSWKVIERNLDIIKIHLPDSRTKVITRVGKDVKASCGMFFELGL